MSGLGCLLHFSLLMTPISPDALQKLNWLIRDCGQQAKQMAIEPFQVFEKGLEDYVTTVDHALDERLSAALTDFFPQDGIVSEENVQSRRAFQETYARLWLIDPLDGTEEFIHQGDSYSVIVGLLQAAQPSAGWIYAPATDRLCFGGPGWGLFERWGDAGVEPAQPLLPQEPPPPSVDFCPVIIGDRDLRNYGAAIAESIPGIQFSSLGSFGLKVLEVIDGRAGAYVYFNRRVKLWDTTGPIALARAAGLVCCDLDGNPLEFTPAVVDPETLIHQQTVVIGWERYVERLRSPLRTIVLG